MEKRGPSRFKPKSVKEIADLAERRAAQDKLARNHPLQARDQAVLEDIERSRKIAEEQVEEESRNLASYARGYPTFDIFYAQVKKAAEMTLKNSDLEGDDLKKEIVSSANRLNLLPNVSVSSPVYRAIAEVIYLACIDGSTDKEEVVRAQVRATYEKFVQGNS